MTSVQRWSMFVSIVALATACTHTELPTAEGPPAEGPFGTASPVRLTFNSDDDAFPVYSIDGASIAYAFAVPLRPDRDRCTGVLPAGGGTRDFSLCEQQVTHADSTDALTPIGLHADGRLFYMHSATNRFAAVPGQTRIYATTLAGAPPQLMMTLPAQVAGGPVTWLGNVHWVADDQFIALGQQMTAVPRCQQCGAARDTLFEPVAVVRGTLSGQSMTLASIPGTEGASGYGLNGTGTELVFVVGGALYRIPITGGTATFVSSLPASYQFVDMDCGNEFCAVLMAGFPGPGRSARIGNALFTVPFGGTAFTSRASTIPFTWWGVRVAPSGTDMVLTVSGATDARDLYLFRGLL